MLSGVAVRGGVGGAWGGSERRRKKEEEGCHTQKDSMPSKMYDPEVEIVFTVVSQRQKQDILTYVLCLPFNCDARWR